MLCHIASLLPINYLYSNSTNITPRYSEGSKRIIVNGNIKYIDLFDYFIMTKDRSNMISYIKDGFTKRTLYFKYFDVISYTDLLYEVLPDVITNDHVSLYLAHSDKIEDLCFHHLIMMFILYPYADANNKQRLVDLVDMNNSATLTQVKDRTLQHVLDILSVDEFNSLYNSSMSYQDIYSPVWGANTLLIKYIADNAQPNHYYAESLYHTCCYLTYGVSSKNSVLTNCSEIMWVGQLEFVVNYYKGNIEELIACANNLPISLAPKRYSHKYNALLLCTSHKIEDEDFILDDFVMDNCEYCQRISHTYMHI